MSDTQLDLRGIPFDPDKYRIDPQVLPLMNDFLFELFRATGNHPRRRLFVSAGFALVVFMIGLLVSWAIGFASIYLASPGVYLLILMSVVVMDQVRWGKFALTMCLNETREAFITTDDDYVEETLKFLKRITIKWRALAIFVVIFALLTVVVLLTLFDASSDAGRFVHVFIPSGFPPDWFTGHDLLVKFAILEWLLLVSAFNFSSVFYISMVVIPGWPRLALRWPVVPVPSYVRTRFTSIIDFYFHGLASNSIAVLSTILLYGGRFEPPLIAFATLFALLGILCLLLPMYAIRQLTRRAMSQVASSVASRYYRHVYPVASTSSKRNAVEGIDESFEHYRELGRLQELMHEANEDSDEIFRLNTIVPVVVSQAVPFLGFLYPLLYPLIIHR
ncbi:MAG TPA: hypothetical protein VFV38_06760 [Ktedonobacteraceae bacterium]|nr:hypothetical protein [Ktedonobacteraceae bacterium]